MPLHWLFPTPVLQVDLEEDAATASGMVKQLQIFETEVFQHPEVSERCNLTGGLLGHAGLDQLHRLDAFQRLNGELAGGVCEWRGARSNFTPIAMPSSAVCSTFGLMPTAKAEHWSFRLRMTVSVM